MWIPAVVPFSFLLEISSELFPTRAQTEIPPRIHFIVLIVNFDVAIFPGGFRETTIGRFLERTPGGFSNGTSEEFP